MKPSAEDRRFSVLRAIVADYIETHEPVGSKALVDRHNLEVSSATVRNDMAVLEAEGYIVQQHTSSGRIPTDAGYRHFVDKLDEIKPLSRSERNAIAQFLQSGVDLDDILRRSVQLLAQLTQQVAVIQYPVLSASTVRHLEIISLSPTRLLLILITDTGRVEQRTVELFEPLSGDNVRIMRDCLVGAMYGKKLSAASAAISQLAHDAQEPLRVPLIRATSVLVETLVENGDERFIIGGAANLTRNASDFAILPGSLLSLLEALEEQVVLLKLLSSTSESVSVKIGIENQDAPIPGASVVSTNYGNASNAFGTIGVVGPTRMDYPGTISSVMAVARYVGEILSS